MFLKIKVLNLYQSQPTFFGQYKSWSNQKYSPCIQYYVETAQCFSDKNEFLYFKCRKTWERAGILNVNSKCILLKHYPVKVPQNWFNSFNSSNQTAMQVNKFSFALHNCHETFWRKLQLNCFSKEFHFQ